MKNDNDALLFVKDLVFIIKEMAQEAKVNKNDKFEAGRHFALYEVLSLIEQQTIAFGYDKKDIGMSDFSLDENIL